MDELCDVLDGLRDDWLGVKELVDTRDREGGQPLIDFLDEIDDLFPELKALCERRWMLELAVRLCNMKEKV